MVDQDYMELIHYEIDGIITAEDRDRLHRYLKEDPEAQALHESVQAVDPPPTLRPSILNTLPNNLYAQETTRDLSAGWFDFLQRRPKLGFSLSFAVGLACGLIWLTLPFELADVNNSDLMGTVQAVDSSQNLLLLSSLDVVEDDFSMTTELKRSETSVFIAMHLRSTEELELALVFDQGDLQFSGFQTEAATKNDLDMDLARVSLRHQGENRFVFAFTDKTAAATAIAVRVYNPELIYENSFDTAPK
jgi:hypothetical protein